ncbi:MAG: hypothetical protein LUC22_07585, partial [Prevotella sp.]|nr:hypothetical protein [Prevotella sp.]
MTKRTLIVALTVLMSTNMFAQQVALDKTQHKCVRPVAKLAPADTPVFGAQDAVTTGKKLSKETGLYYYKPDGSLYWNYLDEDNNVYATTNIFVPAWQDYTFINKADNPADTYWSVGGINYNTSYPSLIDENYNFTYGLEPGYGLPLPHLYNTAGTQSYVMGENTESYEEEYSVIAANNEILQLGFLDDKAVYGGFTSGDYIAGTGTVTDGEGTVWSTVNVCQRYPKPASPLYVENVAIIGVSDSGTPLKNGAKLTLEIYENNGENFYTDNVNYELNENHKLGELKETLTATMDDFTQLTYDSSTGQVQGQFTFTKKVEDPLFGEVEEPFVIDYPSTIVLSDFSDSNVDFGIEGYALED